MTLAFDPTFDDGLAPDLPPGWIAPEVSEPVEQSWFLAGAALAALHPAASGARGRVPLALLRDRLALEAAEACLRMGGRVERASALRDEVHLLRPGERTGPGGAVLMRWREAASLRLARERGGAGGAIARMAAALAETLESRPDDMTGALIAADAALARALGWPHPLPLVAAGLRRRDLAARDAALQAACARAIALTAPKAARLAADLARRAGRLRAAAPKLRAKGAAAVIGLLLAEDALSPSIALSPVVRGTTTRMSDRAARRLCERLVELGALRELTGRSSFRLYGL